VPKKTAQPATARVPDEIAKSVLLLDVRATAKELARARRECLADCQAGRPVWAYVIPRADPGAVRLERRVLPPPTLPRRSWLNASHLEAIKQIHGTDSVRLAARLFGVDRATIRRARSRKP